MNLSAFALGNWTANTFPSTNFSITGGWNFYRETTVVSIDKARLRYNDWEWTNVWYASSTGETFRPGTDYRGLYKETAWAGKAPGIEQPDVTCPAEHQRELTSYAFRRYPYYSGFSQKVAGLKDGKQRQIIVDCYTDYYQVERTDITVGD